MRGEETDDASAEGSTQEYEAGEDEAVAGEDLSESMFASPGRRNWELSPETDYKPFITRFDEIVEAEELCDEEELGRLRAYLDQQMGGLHNVVTRLANRLQRRLLAQQARSWDFDQEEGLLDAARLARVVVNPRLLASLAAACTMPGAKSVRSTCTSGCCSASRRPTSPGPAHSSRMVSPARTPMASCIRPVTCPSISLINARSLSQPDASESQICRLSSVASSLTGPILVAARWAGVGGSRQTWEGDPQRNRT